MNYKNGSDLQHLIAYKYCPHLADEPVESNVASEKEVGGVCQIAAQAPRR